jgi:hypothetical protein
MGSAGAIGGRPDHRSPIGSVRAQRTTLGEIHETSPPQFPASRRGCCSTAGPVADREGADLSGATDHNDRAVCCRRSKRRHRPHHGRAHACVARPAGLDRKRRWGRRQHRHRPCGARCARRLHDFNRILGHTCRERCHLRARLRCREGFRADLAAGRESAADRR